MFKVALHLSIIPNLLKKMSEKRDLVVFLNVQRSYPPHQDLQAFYQRDTDLKPTSRDWVGLFRVGWSSSRDYYTFEWAPSAEDTTKGSVTFAGRRLPPEDGHFYQLCYVTREVRNIISVHYILSID